MEKSSIKHNAINKKKKYKYSPKKEANSKMEFVAAVTKIKKRTIISLKWLEGSLTVMHEGTRKKNGEKNSQ